MKKCLLLLIAAALMLGGCSRILTPETLHIPGRYDYNLSWDCPAPDGVGTMHVDEEGVLWFYPDSTFADTALQHHYLCLPDSTVWAFDFDYRCGGNWKVEEDRFLFCEHSQGFRMDLRDSFATPDRAYFAGKIFNYYCPRNQWVTYEIERLDRRWFVWSMKYSDGSVMYWRMHRSRKR